MAEPQQQQTHAASGPSRIKRNSACTACRDAKVRCNPSLSPDQPCQRCSRLDVECLVDKTHKRVSRKSKLDELVQEIQTIKQTVVDHRATTTTTGAAPPSHAAAAARHMPSPGAMGMGMGIGMGAAEAAAVSSHHHHQGIAASPSTLRPSSLSTGNSAAALPSTMQTPATTIVGTDYAAEGSLPRALGSQVFSGEDIDYYFQMYFEHFHPFMPVVRITDPNKCYDCGSTLFWTIIMTACRRYARSPTVLPFLLGMVRREIFASLNPLPVSIHAINAILLVCTWSFADARFINDPALILSGAALNAALSLGLHRGQASIPDFAIGVYQTLFSDEEAAYTWCGYNIVSERISCNMGLPPLGSLFNQTVQGVIDGSTPFHVPSRFRVLLECHKFMHRLDKSMAACLEESPGVSAHVVRGFEEEFDTLRGLICSEKADDFDRFNALLVQLEIQKYYLMPLAGYNREALKRNALRTYTTAQTAIRQVLELDARMDYIRHMTQMDFRSLTGATCTVFKVFRSSYMEFLDVAAAERTIADCITICQRCSIVEEDLPMRLQRLLESAVAAAQQMPVWSADPVVSRTYRLGASVKFDCMKRWKEELGGTAGAAAAAKARSLQPEDGGEGSGTGTPLGLGKGGEAAAVPIIDWSFMDDFDWNFESNLPLGFPAGS